jgi:hypothetical protein
MEQLVESVKDYLSEDCEHELAGFKTVRVTFSNTEDLIKANGTLDGDTASYSTEISENTELHTTLTEFYDEFFENISYPEGTLEFVSITSSKHQIIAQFNLPLGEFRDSLMDILYRMLPENRQEVQITQFEQWFGSFQNKMELNLSTNNPEKYSYIIPLSSQQRYSVQFHTGTNTLRTSINQYVSGRSKKFDISYQPYTLAPHTLYLRPEKTGQQDCIEMKLIIPFSSVATKLNR